MMLPPKAADGVLLLPAALHFFVTAPAFVLLAAVAIARQVRRSRRAAECPMTSLSPT
jgi:hypothetical protein